MRARLGGFGCPSRGEALVTSTSIDVAMEVVSAASQYFVPHVTDRDHDRAPAVRRHPFNKR
jgi:hypothetical protein